MVNALSFHTINLVLVTWEEARRSPAFEEQVGMRTLEILFEMEPAAKKVFGFPRNFDLKSQKSGLARIGFLIHSKRMIEMLDVALGMIGPEHEILTEILTKLGKRHVHHGVKKEFFPILGEALKDALSERLDGKWTYEVEEAWEIVYGEMSRDIIKGMS